MVEPLSVAASIAGLLSLAGQIYNVLDKFITDTQDAPVFANEVLVEVHAFRNSLQALQSLLQSSAFSAARAALVSSESVVIACTDATLLFSKIEAEVTSLVHGDGFFTRVRPTQKKTKLEALVTRLQWQKTTLILQLNILQW
jgi:cell division control protein 24